MFLLRNEKIIFELFSIPPLIWNSNNLYIFGTLDSYFTFASLSELENS